MILRTTITLGLTLLAIFAGCGVCPEKTKIVTMIEPNNGVVVEELNKRTTMLNEICPTRQYIKQCKEWCTHVDCKE